MSDEPELPDDDEDEEDDEAITLEVHDSYLGTDSDVITPD